MIFQWKLKYSVNITYLYCIGSYYGNSYNKAGYCPSSGRRRRDAESGPEIADARYDFVFTIYWQRFLIFYPTEQVK